ncbi:MAG: hypothetical protein JWN52_2970 [Actinomycetia bacterium]|nr:hypothetical protein [Actinomycetes bacterium]
MTTEELFMEMLASKAAAGLSRTFVKERLSKWGLFHISGDALLITTELVTNAVKTSPWDAPIKLRLSRDADGVLLQVWDSSDEMPTVRPMVELTLDDLDLSPENFDDNGGRGLPIVQALATECGIHQTGPHGKWVWARLKG